MKQSDSGAYISAREVINRWVIHISYIYGIYMRYISYICGIYIIHIMIPYMYHIHMIPYIYGILIDASTTEKIEAGKKVVVSSPGAGLQFK